MLSLGEILEEALRNSTAVQPDPPPLVTWTEEEEAFHYTWLSARELAAKLTDHFSLDFETVWTGLGYVPNEILPLLASPSGWTALADRVASDLGAKNFPLFIPVVH